MASVWNRLGQRRLIPLLLPLLGYLVLSLGGVTTSNIGVDALRQDPGDPQGTQIGEPQLIRSDEYMTDSTIALGWITAGGEGIDNPLNVDPNVVQQLPSGPVSSIVFFDGTFARLGPWLPDAMLFAGKWWLPTLLLLLGLPEWFRLVTGSRRWGYLAVVLILFAPTNAWWSGWPVNTLGFISAAMALLLWAHQSLLRRQNKRAIAAILVASVLMARYPTYYQPYAIVLGLPLLLATAVFLLRSEGGWRPKLVVMGVAGAVGATLTAGTLLESIDSIRAGLETVYPGQRRTTGEAHTFGKVFGATDLGFLSQTQHTLVATNASEISSAPTVLVLVALVLNLVRPFRGSRSVRGAWIVLVSAALLWLAWCTVELSAVGEHLPLLSLVPSMRAANVVGFLAILAFCLFMSQWRPEDGTRRTALFVGLLAAAVSLYAGSSLHTTVMPDLDPWMIWLSSTVVLVVVMALVRWPQRRAVLVGAGVAATALSVTVVPIQVGLADLRGSEAAQFMLAAGDRARDDGLLWASDTTQFDALMFATATPALSSRQQMGPDRDEWRTLDPDLSHQDMWNRGGTYVRFAWTTQPGISWENPYADQVVLTLSPCTLAKAQPSLTAIVSTQELDLPCLDFRRRLTWSGLPQYVYHLV